MTHFTLGCLGNLLVAGRHGRLGPPDDIIKRRFGGGQDVILDRLDLGIAPHGVDSKEVSHTKMDGVTGGHHLKFDSDGAQMVTLRIVIDALKKKGRTPIVFLDASSRHHLGDKGLNEQGFAKALGVPKSQVMVCPARTEADAFILKYARAEDLPVVSNDMFRDRAAQTKGLKFVKGVIVKGRPIFDGL